MSTAAAFLECDPKPECPIEDTYDFDGGGSSKDGSKDKKINPNNIVEKVKDAVPLLPVETTNLPGDIGFKENFDAPKFPGGFRGV
jgi:hypothetical protein